MLNCLDMRKIPYQYICIEGNIGAGKTTLSKMLAEELNCNLILEKFAENPFLEFFYKDPERHAFTVELSFLTERHKQLQQDLTTGDLFTEFNLADYSLIKSLLFARQNLNPEEFKLFQSIFNILSAKIPKPDLILYLHRPIERVKKHIEARARDYEQTIQDSYLETIQNAYLDFSKPRRCCLWLCSMVKIWILSITRSTLMKLKKYFFRISNQDYII